MKSRRLFIKDLYSITLVGGAFALKPSTDFITFLKKLEAGFVPHEFDAWENEFQQIYVEKKFELDKVLQVKTGKSTFTQGEAKIGTSDDIRNHSQKSTYTNSVKFKTTDADAAFNYFSKVPTSMSSPFANINLYADKSNVVRGNQCFRAYNGGRQDLVMFAKNDLELSKETPEEFLLVHPKFNDIIGNAKYFCYGIPVEMPTVSRCKTCNRFYYTQIFCYKANDPDYGVKPVYTQFINDPYCSYTSEEDFKLHDGVTNISELVPCKCYDDIKPLILNKGNLDKNNRQ